MTNCWRAFAIFWLTSSIFAKALNTCSVQPTARVVVVGERVSLNCTADGDFSIRSWQIGTDVKNKTVVYTAPQFGPDRTERAKKFEADGYSVTNVAENKTSLHINQIKVSQAGLYVCTCGDPSLSIATTAVVVLESEPKFSVISTVTNGQQVSFSCSLSFNGFADISSNLTITDVSRSTVNGTACSPNNALTFCNLKYTITANASVDQSYSCSVHLLNNNIIIYSRIVNTSLKWQRVSRAEIVVSNPSKCSAEKCVLHESIICKTDGTPGITDFKWWQMRHNGSKMQIEVKSQHLVLNEIGQFTYQCQAFNKIRGVAYNNISKPFTVKVTETENSPPILIVIGISIAIGVIAIIIAIVVVRICCFRNRKDPSTQEFRQLSTNDSTSDAPQRPPKNRYDKTKVKNPAKQELAPTATDHKASPNNNKTSVGTEVVVFDNDLYEGARCASPNPTAASAIPEENIYNEIRNLD